MAIEETLFTALGPLFGSRFFPDVAPEGVLKPYATWQQVGGMTENPINGAVPGLNNSRIQINVWALTRVQSNTLMRTVEATLRPNPIAGRPIGALEARYDETSELRGAQQDFTIWWI